jgi:hypothetical protein
MDCPPAKMSTRKNYFATLDSDEESRDGVDTRKKELTARVRVKNHVRVEQIAAMVFSEDVSRPWGDLALERDNTAGVAEDYDAIRPVKSFTQTDLYFDMSEEPWKYGEDLGVVRKAVAHDPVVVEKELGERRVVFTPIATEAAKLAMKKWVYGDIRRYSARVRDASTAIQKMVRGYQTKCKNPHLDCCMCLSHRVSPLKTAVGFMCKECAEQGPYVDLVEDDPWNWHRAV